MQAARASSAAFADLAPFLTVQMRMTQRPQLRLIRWYGNQWSLHDRSRSWCQELLLQCSLLCVRAMPSDCALLYRRHV